MTCPVSETWAPGRATIPAGLYQMVLASSAAAAPPAKALPRALVLCVFIPNPPADRWVDRPTRPPPKIAFARIFVHSGIAPPSERLDFASGRNRILISFALDEWRRRLWPNGIGDGS